MNTDIKLQESWDAKTQDEQRNSLLNVQGQLADLAEVGRELGLDVQTKIPVQEFYSDGCYGREVFIPKDTALVGEIHKTAWIIVVSRGKIRVTGEDGIRIIDATEHPVTFISPPGVKRAGYALEDTYWTGFCATELTDEQSIRDNLLCKNYEELDAQLEDKKDVGCDSSDCSVNADNSSDGESERN